MIPRRITDSRTGRRGWQYRFTNPFTRRRTVKTFWLREQRDAMHALLLHLDGLERKAYGLPDTSYLRTSWEDLLKKFLAEAPIASEQRRNALACILGRNPLKLRMGADLTIGNLNAALFRNKELTNHSKINLQSALKQVTRCLAELEVMPINPLAPWRKLKLELHPRHRRAYTPAMVSAILVASHELDAFLGRKFPTEVPLRVLLFTGNRPGAIFATKISDIDWENERINLPFGNGNKRNGRCYLPAAFIPELRAYLALRGHPNADQPLMVSAQGDPVIPVNFSKDFTRLLTLVFTKKNWPVDDPLTEGVGPMEVAYFLYMGNVRGVDGVPPTDEHKISARRQHASQVAILGGKLRAQVEADMDGRDLYALRATHISWARRLTNFDSVRSQVGHAGQDIEEKHYLDLELVHGRESAEAVWDVLAGRRKLEEGREQTIKRLIVDLDRQLS